VVRKQRNDSRANNRSRHSDDWEAGSAEQDVVLMSILERLNQTKRKLWIALGLGCGVLVAAIVVVVVAALILFAWDTYHTPKVVKNQIGIELILVPPGSFMMGSAGGRDDEKPMHQVTISNGFLIGRYEVTAGQWKSVMGKEPPNFKSDDLPAQFITWNGAQEFILRLNQKNDGYTYRLPTEAEWEYACRAGKKGEDPTDIEWLAWYDGNADNRVHRVGERHANDWGLYDMQGNVSEWCRDWYDQNYYGQSPGADPQGPNSGSERVKRGGSRYDNRSMVRASSRQGGTPDQLLDTNGFRIVADARSQ
jgi:formylglycine-generating enzyme required for sulfatase activity